MIPFDNYNRLLSELMDQRKRLMLGSRCQAKRESEISQNMQLADPNSDGAERLRDRISFDRRTDVIMCVAILEAMIKDYAEYYAKTTVVFRGAVPDPALGHLYGRIEEASLLTDPKFREWITKRINEVRRDLTKEGLSIEKIGCAAQLARKVCMNFDHRSWLLKAVVVRDCEVHNAGLMTERAYRRAPLCEVGTKPHTDTAFWSDLYVVLNLLNSRFNECIVEPN